MHNTVRVLGAVALGLVLGACGDNGGPTSSGTGKVSIALTDAPGDVMAAVVTISDVYLQRGTDSTATGDRVYLAQGLNQTYNLLSLQNTLATLVPPHDVPAGHYSQLRFVITGAYIEVANASGGGTTIYATSPTYSGLGGKTATGTLVAPSFATSGLKVLLPNGGLDVQDGVTTSLLADFDVAQSFGHEAGNSGRWVLHPVVKATSVNLASNLTVTLSPATGVTLPTSFTGYQVVLTDASGNPHPANITVTGGVATATFTNLIASNGPFTLSVVAPSGKTFTIGTVAPFTLNVGANTQTITVTAIT